MQRNTWVFRVYCQWLWSGLGATVKYRPKMGKKWFLNCVLGSLKWLSADLGGCQRLVRPWFGTCVSLLFMNVARAPCARVEVRWNKMKRKADSLEKDASSVWNNTCHDVCGIRAGFEANFSWHWSLITTPRAHTTGDGHSSRHTCVYPEKSSWLLRMRLVYVNTTTCDGCYFKITTCFFLAQHWLAGYVSDSQLILTSRCTVDRTHHMSLMAC
jgi:hypothetical protein